jgi:hypothetical protein
LRFVFAAPFALTLILVSPLARADDTGAPDAPSAAPEDPRAGGKGMIVGGGVLAAFAAAQVAGGVALAAQPRLPTCDTPRCGGGGDANAGLHTMGAILIGTGIASGIGAGVMVGVGARRLAGPAAPPAEAYRPELRVGVGSASLRWQF